MMPGDRLALGDHRRHDRESGAPAAKFAVPSIGIDDDREIGRADGAEERRDRPAADSSPMKARPAKARRRPP